MEYVPYIAPSGPRYLAVTHAVIRDIRRGSLPPGASLPSSRALAQRLGLHRNTVVRAYDELAAQGWVVSVQGSGTRVNVELPRDRFADPPEPRPATLAGFPLPARKVPTLPVEDDARYRFMAGAPDLRLLPLTALSRAYRRALRGAGRSLVDYGDPQGSLRLRTALSDWLRARRSLYVPPDRVLLTRGAQQALYLAAHALFAPGDRVAVEAYGYRPAWEALRTAGVALVPVPVDEWGLDVDALAAVPDLAGVYVTPHHQYPTGAMLSAGRRDALLRLARDRRIAILEDDYDHEFHWAGSPVAPLASQDRAGVVVYLGTLSKAFAPGLRLGWMTAPAPAIERLTALRRLIDRQGDRAVEHAVAELLTEGEVDRHIRRMHRTYRERRQVLLEALATELPDLVPNDPPGGLGFFCRADGIDVDAWAARCQREESAIFQTARAFRFDGRTESALRLGFPAHTPGELRAGVRGLARSLARERDHFGIGARWSRALPGTSSRPVLLRTADGDLVQKTFRSPRAFEQARAALRRAAPERIVAEGSPTLLLRRVPGEAGPMTPEAHAAAARWLKAWQTPAPDDLQLSEAYALRLRNTTEEARRRGLPFDVEPDRFAGERVWCHRDFRPSNWVWQSDTGALAVLDFEHARPDHPLVDLVRLATEVWPDHPELEQAFTEAYGPFDRSVLDALIRVHGVNTLAWGERHGDPAVVALGRRILGLR